MEETSGAPEAIQTPNPPGTMSVGTYVTANNAILTNNEVIAILMDLVKFPNDTPVVVNASHQKNPQQTIFLNAKMSGYDPDPLKHLLPEGGVRSNLLPLEVTRRSIPAHEPGDSLFCMQWEMWFVNGPRGWRTAQSVPSIGFYDTFNLDSIRQHMLWFMDMGVDFIMLDWSNHIWGRQHWSERSEHVNMLLHATQLSLEVLASMRAEGLPVPKVVIMPGLSNGRPCSMEALNEELDWIYQNYYRLPRFKGLWQEFEGKPLVVILDTGGIGDKRARSASSFRIPFFKMTLEMSEAEMDAFRQAQGPVDDAHFTIRWLSSQNQATRHHELGSWSWMDGVLDPPVTYKDGVAEAVTVTPTFFNALGWLDKEAYGRRGGTGSMDGDDGGLPWWGGRPFS